MNPPMQAASARFVGAPRPSSDTLFATWSSFKAGDEGDEDAGQELARHLVFLRKRTLFDLAECEERENEYESDKEAAASQSPLQDAVEYVDEDREGQDEGAENASAGRPKPSPQPCGAKQDRIWSKETHAAFLRGCKLIPCLGAPTIAFQSKRLGRSCLVAKYVRRQTGVVLTRSQVNSHMNYCKRLHPSDSNLIKGERVDTATLANKDWSALLGPDLFPHVDAVVPTRVGMRHCEKQNKRVRMMKPDQHSQDAAGLSLPPLRVPPPPHSLPYNHLLHASHPARAFPTQPLTAASPFSDPPSLPEGNTAVSPIHRPSPSSLPPPSMDDVDDRTPLSSSDHTAFLTSFFPTSSSTDLTSTANFLHPAGLSTVEDLAAFLAIDAGLYAVVVEKAIKKGRLGQEEAARVREVLKVAREAFEAQ